jgi:hypothetical protein
MNNHVAELTKLQIPPLRFASDDKGRLVTFLKSSEWDVEIATMTCLVHSSLNLPQAGPVLGMTILCNANDFAATGH